MMARWVAVAILVWLAPPALAEPCKWISIRPQERAAALSVARQLAELPIDSRTFRVCRYSAGLFANIFTERQKLADGTERRDVIQCDRSIDGSRSWRCDSLPERNVKLKDSHVPASRLEIPLWMRAAEAQPLAEKIYGALAMLSGSDLCADNPAQTQEVDAMRAAFRSRASGDLFFHGDSAEELSLSRGDYFIKLAVEPDPPASLRAQCWGRYEELEE
jgi:hypothetical protein